MQQQIQHRSDQRVKVLYTTLKQEHLIQLLVELEIQEARTFLLELVQQRDRVVQIIALSSVIKHVEIIL
jgi:hypothetical protein